MITSPIARRQIFQRGETKMPRGCRTEPIETFDDWQEYSGADWLEVVE